MGPTCIGSKKKNPAVRYESSYASQCPIQPPLSGWESLDGCNAIGAESTPKVDLPSTVIKSGPPSIATTVVEGPTIGANVGSTAEKASSSAIATGVRSAGTSNGAHRLSPLTTDS